MTDMKRYTQLNLILGWFTFAISAFVYLTTMEPTASFWDCGEFIASSYKLLVGHPPGAPVFMIVGRIFTLFAPDPTKVALMVNSLSALVSAFTIVFLFWTITHLAKLLVVKKGNQATMGETIAIMGAGLVGALAYTFSDTFWFSAVEGEVYASSSLFTAIAFWAILKWENEADEPHANRWIIMIGYVIGLSIGVHLLNLLTIPAIGLVYYFRKYKTTNKGTLIAIAVSALVVLIIMYGIIPGTVKIAAAFDLFFVNTMGLPFNSGVLFFLVVLIGSAIFGIIYTIKKGKVLWNTIITFVVVILIGYSSFAVIFIRSNANPPMDQNSPDNLFSLLSYLNREQYGDRPLVYGQYYSAPYIAVGQGSPVRYPMHGEYKIIDYKQTVDYDKRFNTLFPRMYSSQPRHIGAYKSWAGVKGNTIRAKDPQTGEMKSYVKPTMGENLKFFARYQFNFMYWRYFMWNFAGRQNDIQGHGEIDKGNWISGINFVDKARLGDQTLLPDNMKNNKARNKYYFLPFILGLLGIGFQVKKWKQGGFENFSLVGMLFFMTGIAIVIYLNQYPFQPRERDYAFAGSFYAFSIWIGLGVLFIWDQLRKYVPSTPLAVSATVLSLVLVPGIMATENWDDHDRSDRYMCRDFATNYLNSCEENGIIFTNGDNDTFPLWYVQEVEGVRTDIRVCNLSYLQTDWYIDQMRRKAYKSDPLPYSLTKDKTLQGRRDLVLMQDLMPNKGPVDLKQGLKYLGSDRVETKNPGGMFRENMDHFPSHQLRLSVDTDYVVRNNVVPEGKEDRIVSDMAINFSPSKRFIRKNDLMVLDLLANNNWQRPIYFAVTVPKENYVNLQKYFHTEGLTYKVAPVVAKTNQGETGEINTAMMYDNMMNKFVWGNVDKPGVYMEENTRRMCLNYRNNFVRLANALLLEGKNDLAVNALKKSMEVLPEVNVPYNQWSILMAESCYRAGLIEDANHIIKAIQRDEEQTLNYFFSMNMQQINSLRNDIQTSFYVLSRLRDVSKRNQQEEISASLNASYETLSNSYIKKAKLR